MSASTTDDLYLDDDDTADGGAESSDDLRSLRRAANKSRKLEKENEALRRQLAFSQVPGLNTADPKVGYFIKGYEGETTPEAILQAAQAAGFVESQQPSQEQAAAAQADQRFASVAAGAQPLTGLDPEAQLEQAMAEGGINAMLAKAQELGIPITQ